MSKKDLSRPDHFANPPHQSDDEDGPEDSAHPGQPSQGRSGAVIKIHAERNKNKNGQQKVGNVKGSFLPLRGNFFVNADNNVNEGKLQDAGNVVFCNTAPSSFASSSESNYAHRNHSPSTDPPAAQDPGQGASSRRAVSQEIKDNKSSKGVQEFGNFKLEKTSAIAFFDGGEVSQTIVGNSNEGEIQKIGNIETFKDDVDNDAR